jgi:excinuclease ABC subunit C
MREVLQRRWRLLTPAAETDAAKPKADDGRFRNGDLVIIDGGPASSRGPRDFDGFGLTQCRCWRSPRGGPDAAKPCSCRAAALKLEPRDPVLYFIQQLRTGASSIGSHRKLRRRHP